MEKTDLLFVAGGAGLIYLLWPKIKAAAGGAPAGAGAPAPSAVGSGVLQPAYQVPSDYPSSLNIDWSNIPSEPAAGSGVLLPQYQNAPAAPATPTPAATPTWYQPGGQGAGPTWYNGLDDYGYAAGADPRPVAWMQLAEMVRVAQGQLDDTWARYNASWLNRICAGAGFCPAMQNTADMVTSSQALASALVGLAQELASNPDATYEDGSPKSRVFEQTASRYVGRISSLVAQVGENAWPAAVRDFIVRFPSSVAVVLSYTVDAAGNVVAGAAWGLSKTALILGGAAALVLFMLSKSGAQINAGPVKVG